MSGARIRVLETIATEESSETGLGDWYNVMRDDPCPFCGIWMTPAVVGDPLPTDATKDHIEPRANGAHASYENIVMVCRACNGKKADRSLLKHLRMGGMRRSVPSTRHAASRSRHKAAWIVLMAREHFGRETFARRTRRTRKVRQMVAWVALSLGARARHVAHEMGVGDSGRSVVAMAEAWDRKRHTNWAREQVRGFVGHLRKQSTWATRQT